MATSDNTNMTDTSRPEERFTPATYSPGMLAGDFIGRTAPSLHHWMMPDCWSPQASGGFRNSSEFFSQSPLPQSTVQTNSTPVQRPVIGTQELHGGHCQFGYQQQIPNFASPVQHLESSYASETSSGVFSLSDSTFSDLGVSPPSHKQTGAEPLRAMYDSGCDNRTLEAPAVTKVGPSKQCVTGSSKGHSSLKKPTDTYIAMIGKALLTNPKGQMVLADIYHYVLENYPYYRTAPSTWKNSIRHNLSVNECFVKARRAEHGRGFYWAIHPACIDAFKRGDFRRREARRLAKRMYDLLRVKSPKPQSTSLDSTTKMPVNHSVGLPGVQASGHVTYGIESLPQMSHFGCSFPSQVTYGHPYHSYQQNHAMAGHGMTKPYQTFTTNPSPSSYPSSYPSHSGQLNGVQMNDNSMGATPTAQTYTSGGWFAGMNFSH